MLNMALLLGLISIAQSQDSLFISTEPSPWSIQNGDCILATPDVKAAYTDYQINESLDIELPLNERVWVGYYQVVRVFEYIGCVSMSNIFNNEEQHFVEIKGDPGHCFPECGDNLTIGVTRTKCYCFGSELDISNYIQLSCPHTCIHPTVACGRAESSNPLLSIYKLNPNVTARNVLKEKEERNCLALDPHVPKKFIWDLCERSYVPMCTDGKRVQIVEGNGIRKLPWFFATKLCFRFGMVPAVFSDPSKVDLHNDSPLWTGLFKTNVVYKLHTEASVLGKVDKRQFGYLTRDSEDRVKLQFTEINANHKRLCIQGDGVSKQNTEETIYISNPIPVTGETSGGDGSNIAIIAAAIFVSLVGILLVSVSLACFYKHRSNHNVLSEMKDVKAVYSTTVHGNDATEVQPDVCDASSQYNKTTPDEIVYQHNQTIEQTSNENGISSAYNASLEIGMGNKIFASETQSSQGAYAFLQDGLKEQHNYETPTNVVYESVKESMKDIHLYEHLN